MLKSLFFPLLSLVLSFTLTLSYCSSNNDIAAIEKNLKESQSRLQTAQKKSALLQKEIKSIHKLRKTQDAAYKKTLQQTLSPASVSGGCSNNLLILKKQL